MCRFSNFDKLLPTSINYSFMYGAALCHIANKVGKNYSLLKITINYSGHCIVYKQLLVNDIYDQQQSTVMLDGKVVLDGNDFRIDPLDMNIAVLELMALIN